MEKRQWLIERVEEEIIEKIKKLETRDNKVVKAGVKVLRNDKWQIEDDLVLKEEKVYVPRDEKLRLEIIQLHYNIPIVEYEGQ